jgi:RES domain-containing protein
MHRLIPSRYSEPERFGGSDGALSGIADTAQMLEDIALLDAATNERIRTERRGSPGIGTYELVYGVPNAHIVNAAFTHTGEDGGRFNDPSRGAWYAANELDTSLNEIAYHRARRLADIVVPHLPDKAPDTDTATYDDWLADFRAAFHRLEPNDDYREYLQHEPVPACYAPSQRLARTLLRNSSNGIVYPSVRRLGHSCLACFRPALVYNPRRDARLNITLKRSGNRYEMTFLADISG